MQNVQVGHAILLTDGTVMIQGMDNGYGTRFWYRLAPDQYGNYADGTTAMTSMPASYAPLFYASAVLPDGRLLIEGGEHNGTQSFVETTMGEIYDPVAGTWTAVSPPSGWGQIGDADSVVLPNGTFMLGACCSSANQALLNAFSLTWASTGTNKADPNAEEGWALLPNGKVLTVELGSADGRASELYDPSTGSWSQSGAIPITLDNSACNETGPMVLRPDGTVVAIGGTGYMAIYNSAAGTWSAGPLIGNGWGDDDGPAALLPDGNIFFQVSPYNLGGCYAAPSEFLEFNGTSLIVEPSPPNGGSDASYQGSMLLLPNGQVLFTDGSTDVELYTPSGTYQAAWQPTITSVPTTLDAGGLNYTLSGTQLNGLSQGAMYGDDAQMASNFPLVRVTNDSTQHVFYCRTHNFSTMGVATGSQIVSAEFDLPANIETGPSTLVTVANGIPSAPVDVTVDPPSGQITVSPVSLGFRSDRGSPQTDTSTITNNGPGSVAIYSIDVSGNFFYYNSSTCGTSLGQGQSCYTQVTFSPGGCSGFARGTLTYYDSVGTQVVQLSGTTYGCEP